MGREETYAKRRYHALKSMGKCVACGKPSKEKTRCPECMKALCAAAVVSNRKRIQREREELARLRKKVAELEGV